MRLPVEKIAKRQEADPPTCGESSDAGICFSIANFSASPISLAMKRLAS